MPSDFRPIKLARLITNGDGWAVARYISIDPTLDLWKPIGDVYLLRDEDSELITKWKAAYDALTEHRG